VTSADTRDVTSALSSELVDRSECILIVDDEPAVRQLITGILAKAGHRVLTASSGPEAIGILETEDVALVLSDINMPGSISGLELIDALHARRPSLPIVFVTGSVDETSLQEAMDRGAAGFITKPFKALELTRKVETAISRRLLTEVELRERLLAPTVASVLANAIEVRDSSMEGHTERLAALALEIGRRQRLSDQDLEALELGAVLHDIGKIGIPDSILRTPGPLPAEERAEVERHPEIGDRMLAPLALLESVRPIVKHHHEHWDGGGYPDGLVGDGIPLLARIVSIADSIEAMSSLRPYRSPLSEQDVVRELAEGRGCQWDPSLVDIALQLIAGGQLRFGPSGMSVLAVQP
jgi:putative two-component system response regulator